MFSIIQYTKTKVVVINPLILECQMMKMKRISKEGLELALTIQKASIKMIDLFMSFPTKLVVYLSLGTGDFVVRVEFRLLLLDVIYCNSIFFQNLLKSTVIIAGPSGFEPETAGFLSFDKSPVNLPG